MCTEELTKEQKAFLEECNLEFSERFTDSDLEYKEIYDLGIPPPPIMYPWFGSGKGRYNRDRAGSSRYNDQYRDRNRDNDQYRDQNRDYHSEGNSYRYKYKDRYRPY